MTKKVLSVALILCLIFTIGSLPAFAADPVTINLDGNGVPTGSGTEWSYDDAANILTLNSGYEFIINGSLHGAISTINNGTILSGTFNTSVTNKGVITDGKFMGAVGNGTYKLENGTMVGTKGTINGGTYSNAVANYGIINKGIFNGEVISYSQNQSQINNGTFYGKVNNDNIITDGEFNGNVTNNFRIEGGTFNGEVENVKRRDGSSNSIENGTFNGKVTNRDTIYDGIFNSAVINEYLILNGTFKGAVTNNNQINDGIFTGGVYNTNGIIHGRLIKGIVKEGTIGGELREVIVTGGTITEVGASSAMVKQRETVNVTADTVAGKTFIEWKAEGITLADNKAQSFSITAGTENIKITAVYNGDGSSNISAQGAEPEFAVTQGAGTAWNSGSAGGLTLKCEKDIDTFSGMWVDGAAISSDSFTLKSGSTIVTLKPQYLKTLSAGTHYARFIYTDGFAQASFTIGSGGHTNPQTGIWFS